MAGAIGAEVPGAIRRLMERTLLASFRITPPPASLAESMAINHHIGSVIGKHGRIIHYNQALCPVTKQRLEKLTVLVEDLHRPPKAGFVDIIASSESLVPVSDLSKLEAKLIAEFGEDDRVRLLAASRDLDRIQKLRHLQLA